MTDQPPARARRALGWPIHLPASAAIFAVVVAMFAVGGRAGLQPFLGNSLPFVLAFPATMLAALRYGATAGLLTAALAGLWALIPGLPPGLSGGATLPQVGVFAASAVLVSLVCAHYRRPTPDAALRDDARAADTSATRWLRALVVAAAVIPLTAYLEVCAWGYQRAFSDATKAVLQANNAVARQAERTLAMTAVVAARVQELSAGPDAELRAHESDMHRRLNDLALGVTSIVSVSVFDRDGQSLAHSSAYPASKLVSIADRPYFLKLRDGGGASEISELVTARLSGQSAFAVAYPRRLPDGTFNGVITVALSPAFFQDFYRSLVSDAPGVGAFTLFRADGVLLARWPLSPTFTRIPERSPLIASARAGQAGGVLRMQSNIDRERRLISFMRVGDMPLYVAASLTEGSILAGWYRFVELLSAIVLPTTAGLVYVSWVALKRTRSEQAALVGLQEQMQLRVQAEQALLQTQKLEALSELTGGVAHDFNNLLGVVSNSVQLVKHLHPEIAKKLYVTAITRAVDSGAKLTRQLLSFSRRQALNPEIIVMQAWLPEVGQLVRTTLGRAVELRLDVDADASPIEVDAAEFELALLNLAVNAKDAMPQGGVFRIAVANVEPAGPAGPGRVAVRATDSGSGMPPELLNRVFEPFFTTKPRGKGTGLGLSQVYGLCVQAGGAAEIESAVGKGTTVTLLFPAAEPRREPSASSAVVAETILTGRVLIVEDNDELAQIQVLLLKSIGFEVTHSASADLAYAMLSSGLTVCDVVLSDISMTGSLDGMKLAFRLRETMPGLPVILMTGYASRVNEATEAGFVVLSKPVALAALLSELQQAIAASRRLAHSQPG